MTAHTTEPLAYREADEEEQYMRGCDFVIEQRDFTDNCKQIVAYCDDEHDARRIVACVNACAGKTNEQLEGAAGKLFTGSAIALWSNYCDLKEKNAALSEQVAISEHMYQSGCHFEDRCKELSAQVEELVAVIEDAYQHLAVCRSSPEEMWKLFLRIEAERNKAIAKAGSHE